MKKTQTQEKRILPALVTNRIADNAEEGKKATSVDYADIVKSAIVAKIVDTPAHSAWDKGVKKFAVDLFKYIAADRDVVGIFCISAEDVPGYDGDWWEFSFHGNRLVHDSDIAETLCTPSELKRKKGGALPPKRGRTWRDVQVQALEEAWCLVLWATFPGNLELKIKKQAG